MNYSVTPANQGVLEGCAGACAGYSFSFSSLLQEKFIENHTPIYWAIINRPIDQVVQNELISDLLRHASPLTSSTISEIRCACQQKNEETLFQSLRLSRALSPLSGTDEMLLGQGMYPDSVSIDTSFGDSESFVADIEISQFQKRMRVVKEITVEFIARCKFSLSLHPPRCSDLFCRSFMEAGVR